MLIFFLKKDFGFEMELYRTFKINFGKNSIMVILNTNNLKPRAPVCLSRLRIHLIFFSHILDLYLSTLLHFEVYYKRWIIFPNQKL